MSGRKWIRKKVEMLWSVLFFTGASAVISTVFLFSENLSGGAEERKWECAEERMQEEAQEAGGRGWRNETFERLSLESGAANAQNSHQPNGASDFWDPAPKIALTFDDGPHPFYTEQILDGLKERGVKATFFVLGRNLSGNEAVIKRMDEEGHLIGNHTYNHSKLDTMSHQKAVEEIEKTSSMVEKITGHGTAYVRPPFGIWNKNLEYEVSMIPVLWNIDPLDWTTKNVAAVVDKAVKGAKDQGILLFHDYYASSVEAALQTVDLLQKRGYEFVTVDELILE